MQLVRMLLAALLILMIALLATTLSACSPTPTPEEPTAIIFAIPATTTFFTQANFRGLADAFNQANPDLEIHLRTITF